jgi:hypothetical protein
MCSSLAPFIRDDAVIDLFDLLDDHAYQVVEAYLRNHAWDDEAKRLRESRFTGVGTYRLLTNVCVEYLDGSIEELIAFYERCKRPKDDPHYEDLITTVFIGVVTGILANRLYDSIKRQDSNFQYLNELALQLWERFGRSVNYLIRARWLREKLWDKKISKEDHDVLLGQLIRKYLDMADKSGDNVDLTKLVESELEFQKMAERHDLKLEDLQNSLIVTLIEITHNIAELDDVLEEFKALLKNLEDKK